MIRATTSAATLALLAAIGPCLAGQLPFRDLTVEQVSIARVGTPRPCSLRVSLAADRADWTYAVGESVRLLLTTNEDAYVTVLDIGPTGRVTQLFPNPYQPDNLVSANSPVEIAGVSGARVTATGSVGAELIKVIATNRPVPAISESRLRRHGAFLTVDGGAPTVLRDLEVVADQAARSHTQVAVVNVPLCTIANSVAGAPARHTDFRGGRDRAFPIGGVPSGRLVDGKTACASL